MSTHQHQPITSVPEFLAHALELEVESGERYRLLADSMEIHNNTEVADLFTKMAHYSDLHAQEVAQRAAAFNLPTIAPWSFKWSCPDTPEAPCMEEANYLMTTTQALRLALHNEVRGRDFYARVSATTPDPEVSRLAREMADEEQEHVVLLEIWVAQVAPQYEEPMEDLDPPNITE